MRCAEVNIVKIFSDNRLQQTNTKPTKLKRKITFESRLTMVMVMVMANGDAMTAFSLWDKE